MMMRTCLRVSKLRLKTSTIRYFSDAVHRIAPDNTRLINQLQWEAFWVDQVDKMVTTWDEVRIEAQDIIRKDTFMDDIVRRVILDHDDFASAITELLSDEFNGTITSDRWRSLFSDVFNSRQAYDVEYPTVEEMGLMDLRAVMERDPASEGMVNPFLFFKGFKAIQTHRIAHVLWLQGRRHAAHAVQSRCSDLFGVDIHPAAKIG